VARWWWAYPERVETVRAEWAQSRTGVLGARRACGEQVEWALLGRWSGRLRRLVADVDPARGATITLRAAAFDSSRVNQAGCDLHVTTGK
jgi:hypothetical protein